MQLTLSSDESRFLLRHLAQRIEHLDAELVHTDKRELQRSLAADVNALRGISARLSSEIERDDTTKRRAVTSPTT